MRTSANVAECVECNVDDAEEEVQQVQEVCELPFWLKRLLPALIACCLGRSLRVHVYVFLIVVVFLSFSLF